MTTVSQGNKKIIGSLGFFKKYQQPMIKFWSVPVLLRKTVWFLISVNYSFNHLM